MPKQIESSADLQSVTGWLFLCVLSFLCGRLRIVGLLAGLPDAIPHWHRRCWRLFWRLFWRVKSRPRGGRPKIDDDLIARIRQLSAENPLWGAPRIHGELLKEDYHVAQSTVSRYMLPRKGRPSQGWATFLRNHRDGIVAIDMLCVPTLGFRRLYALVVLGHNRRKILHIAVTHHPNAPWLAWQIALAFPGEPPEFLIRDNDGAYGMTFRRKLHAMGIRDRPTRPHSPWQNGHVERVIGSIRRECLDHIVIMNARHLDLVLQKYAQYYNEDRTHMSLEKDAPNFRPIEREGTFRSRPILGGLHHRYYRTPD